MAMIRMNCDYLEGAHPNILNRLMQTNYDQTIPYGFDEITESAKEKIKKACECPDGEVFFMVGGTQTNATMLDFILDKAEGVISADTGHTYYRFSEMQAVRRAWVRLPPQGSAVFRIQESVFWRQEAQIHTP